jgi:hypothetical protein
MDLTNKQVSHFLFGLGQVVGQENNILKIKFSNYDVKCFVYPDAFEKYLRIGIPEFEEEIKEDIMRKKAEAEAEKERIQKQIEEENLQKEKARSEVSKKRQTSTKSKSAKTKINLIDKSKI